MNIVVRNNISSKLKNPTSEIGYYSYTNRYLQGGERETVEHKLKILKQEIEHII